MAAYLVVTRDRMLDAEAYEAYGAKARPTVAGYGGKAVIANGRLRAVEGETPDGVIVLEFPTFEAAEAWYFGPEYQAVIGERLGSTQGRAVIVEGVPAG